VGDSSVEDEKRKPSEIGVDEYLWAAPQVKSYKALARFLRISYKGMHHHLHNKLGIWPEVGTLFVGAESNPGPKRPPVPLIEGAGPDAEPDVEAILEAMEKRFAEKEKRAAQKEDQHIRFSHGPVAMFFLGDQHFGNLGTDVKRAFDEQEIILNTPGSYVFQLGDTVDNFIVGKLIAENLKPSAPVREQWWVAQEYLERFKEKLVAAVAGNHEGWVLKVSGIDFAREITPSGVLYDADELKVAVHVGAHQFKVWARHKWRGSSIYSQTHGQERAARFDSADHDIYVGAHTHTGAVAREFILNRTRKLAVQTGSYKRHDDFQRMVGFPDSDASTACAVVLHDDGSYFAASDLRAIQNYMTRCYTPAA
jgi:hypothetical protein